MSCKNCGSNSFEEVASSHTKYCVDCGVVAEENTIVSSLTFSENSNGGHNQNGVMVSFDKTKAAMKYSSGYSHSESREVTIYNATRKAREIACGLRLHDVLIEKAIRYFKLLLNKNATRGRRIEITISALLYIACREEPTPHMLIDFSDLLQTSVFVVGSAFLKIIRLLQLKIPLIDPSIFIFRYSSLMGFGDKARVVASTAIRIVGRMKRDWINEGRRPAGLIGASLLLASRIHHFNRTIEDVMMLVKMSGETIKKRLKEFAETPSGRLTVGQFMDVILEEECDPPAYTRARMKEEQLRLAAEACKEVPDEKEPDNEKELNDEDLKKEVQKYLELQKQEFVESEDVNVPEEDLSKLDDDELKSMFLNDDEVKLKTEVWMDENADYLDAQEAKRRREALGLEGASAKRTKRKNVAKPKVSAINPADAVVQYFEQNKLSRKINYDAVRKLF